MIFLLSGPSGVGKTTIADLICTCRPSIHRPVSYTTRVVKRGEVNGRDYHFINHANFEQRVKKGFFAEHAKIGGEFYGTSNVDLNVGVSNGDVLLEIDIQGTCQVKRSRSETRTIFIYPPSPTILKKRLCARKKEESEGEIRTYMKRAQVEMGQGYGYDFQVTNFDLRDTLKCVLKFIDRDR